MGKAQNGGSLGEAVNASGSNKKRVSSRIQCKMRGARNVKLSLMGNNNIYEAPTIINPRKGKDRGSLRMNQTRYRGGKEISVNSLLQSNLTCDMVLAQYWRRVDKKQSNGWEGGRYLAGQSNLTPKRSIIREKGRSYSIITLSLTKIQRQQSRKTKGEIKSGKMDLSELVQKTQEWSVDEPVVKLRQRTRGTGEMQILAGKMVTSRRITAHAMKNILSNAWPEVQGLKISDVNANSFVFNFNTQTDKEKTWRGRPWKVSETLLVLKEWDSRGKASNIDFSKAEMWVQIHDLPMWCRTTGDLQQILEASFTGVTEIDESGLSSTIWFLVRRGCRC
ncbi:hypothetical protein LINPERHAP1_LOCUS20333 [Linum perenne]